MYNLITPDYAAHWKLIGTGLGIREGTLLAIKRNFPDNVKWCCNALLEEWLNTDINATWKKLIQVIDSLNEGILITTMASAPNISSQVPPGSYT